MRFSRVFPLVLVFIGSLHAGGFMLSGVGSRGLGSAGGGYQAVVSGWDAVFWNPAGLANPEPRSVELYFSLVYPRSSFEPHTGILGYDGPYSMRYKVNAEQQVFKIPAFGVYYGSEGWIDGYGFALFAPFGLGTSFDLYDPPVGYYVTNDTTFEPPQFPQHDWVSDLKVTAAWVGIAKKLTDRISVGFSGGPVFASVYFRRVDFLDPAEMESSAVSLPIQYRLWPLDIQLSGTGIGVGMGFGVQYRAGERLRVGLTGRYYPKLKLEGQDSIVLYLPRNDFIASFDTSLAFLFSGATIPALSNGTAYLPLPWTLSMGMAYEASHNLTLGLSLDLNGHSVVDIVPVEFDSLVLMDNRIEAETLKLHWQNTLRISAGASYRFPSSVVIRGGLYYESSPIPDSTFTPLITDTGDKLSVNAGMTLPITSNIEISGNIEAIIVDRRDIKADSDYSYRSNYLPGNYNSFIGAGGLSLKYKF